MKLIILLTPVVLCGCTSTRDLQNASNATAGVLAMRLQGADPTIADGAKKYIHSIVRGKELPRSTMQPEEIVQDPARYRAEGEKALEDSADSWLFSLLQYAWVAIAGIGYGVLETRFPVLSRIFRKKKNSHEPEKE